MLCYTPEHAIRRYLRHSWLLILFSYLSFHIQWTYMCSDADSSRLFWRTEDRRNDLLVQLTKTVMSNPSAKIAAANVAENPNQGPSGDYLSANPSSRRSTLDFALVAPPVSVVKTAHDPQGVASFLVRMKAAIGSARSHTCTLPKARPSA